MGDPKDHIVRTSELGPDDEMHVSHPYNERSSIFMARLSDRTGLSHLGISRARLPPGAESFARHVHTIQEEWIYVVSGTGVVCIDDAEVAIGPGDFVGFPPNGPAHIVRNDSDAEDLVYLQGGDRRKGDRGYFPDLRKVGYQHDEGHMALVDEEHLVIRPYSDWLAKE